MLYLPWTAEWYQFLDTPNLRAATAARPRVFAKLQRPFLTRRHRVPARLAALKQHCGYIDRTLPAATLDAICRPGGLHLATFPLDEGRSGWRTTTATRRKADSPGIVAAATGGWIFGEFRLAPGRRFARTSDTA